MDRRSLLKLGCTVAAAAALPACTTKGEKNDRPPPIAKAATPVDASSIRVASVPTAVDGNLLPTLIADFERETKLRVVLTSTSDVYELARGGKVDLAISHYGHKHAEAFVMDGFGEFPRTLFSNQMALVGPPSDPANVRGLTDAGEAFRRIAATRSAFMMNDLDGVQYLVEILWNLAGKPAKDGWFIDEGRRKEDAIRAAAEQGAYSFWGLTPFLRLDDAANLDLEPLVVGDPLLQRMLVSIVARDSKLPGVNAEGARALQSHFLSPATQAKMRDVRYPGFTAVSWSPGGRHNRTAMLPRTR